MSATPRPTYYFFFFNDTATTEIYTLSLHDALPISPARRNLTIAGEPADTEVSVANYGVVHVIVDRKSTRLNSSHSQISYAVFCLKKKKRLDARHRQDSGSVQRNNVRLRSTFVRH